MAAALPNGRIQVGYKPATIKSAFTNDFPVLEDGSTMHLQVKPGDVANLVLSVGDEGRAIRISTLLDDTPKRVVLSSRGFKIITGTFDSVPVSIVVTGMGLAMMDFVVRECRFVVTGPMSIIRLGTTGVLKSNIAPGSLIVANASRCCQSDFDHESALPFKLTKSVPADPDLTGRLISSLKQELGEELVASGLDITCDFFYSSQGRCDPNFEDCNEGLVDYLTATEPEATNFQMETYCLLNLAQKSRGTIRAAATSIGLINRVTHETISPEDVRAMEISGGYAVLKALTSEGRGESTDFA
eukprot:CAMPEP_0204911776 /NCGR_PEP_ID=MMETSP1397-20131031/10046_1 /ASSEMBLY_ACC=CAM_ASM_000891 /TAXON_ID=49980 /ORGANISM="Climacostomum Climacostomum virens, Strain Stock W-24" /LENGTH=299 /DNA_ID=CAMNT_0052082449 /DNA_START=41 /DNA_END=940 /DNA_ORIENTATION=+